MFVIDCGGYTTQFWGGAHVLKLTKLIIGRAVSAWDTSVDASQHLRFARKLVDCAGAVVHNMAAPCMQLVRPQVPQQQMDPQVAITFYAGSCVTLHGSLCQYVASSYRCISIDQGCMQATQLFKCACSACTAAISGGHGVCCASVPRLTCSGLHVCTGRV